MQFASDASERYLKHKETCTNHFKQLQDLPTFDDRIDFLQFNSQYLEEIVIYYDLESMLDPIEGGKMSCNVCLGVCKCVNDQCKKSYTVNKQLHAPNI